MKQRETSISFCIFFLAGRKEHDILYPLKDLLDWTKLCHLLWIEIASKLCFVLWILNQSGNISGIWLILTAQIRSHYQGQFRFRLHLHFWILDAQWYFPALSIFFLFAFPWNVLLEYANKFKTFTHRQTLHIVDSTTIYSTGPCD